MTIVFKHMTRENAEKLTRGEIRIGSFFYYHNDEHYTEIQDKHEGMTVGHIEDNLVITSKEPVDTVVAGLKVHTESDGKIHFGKGVKTIRQLPPFYIYSTSLIEKVGHFKNYDTVIKINDIESFAKIILDERQDLFHRFHANFVTYESRTYNALNHQGIEPDPFIKDISFKQDEEFRLVFVPKSEVQQYVTFSSKKIQQAFYSGLCELIN